MAIQVTNTSSQLSGKTLIDAEDTQTITGAKTFDLDPAAPFIVTASSAKVTNLDADKLDGEEGTAFHSLVNATNWSTASLTWSNWTPTWTNITVGNGSNIGRYIQIGKYIAYTATLSFGTTTSVSGTVSLNYPVNAAVASAITGECTLRDDSSGLFYHGFVFLVSGTSQSIRVDNGTAGGAMAVMNSTTPFTWANLDGVFITGFYEAA